MKNKLKQIIIFIMLIAMITPATIFASEDNKKIMVIPGGEAFGIKMFSKGLIVTRIEGFDTKNETKCPARIAGIEVNDIILSANNADLNSNNDFKKIIENSNGNGIELKIKREEKEFNTTLIPIMNKNNEYKAGMWIKDSAAGLGTISFYCSETGTFCGLGHGICEKDTGELMPISFGEVTTASISSVTKSICGNVGTLNGYFTDEIIGIAKDNCDIGIYGTTEKSPEYKVPIELGKKDEVNKGDAFIITTTSDCTIKKYDIVIKRIKRNSEDINMTISIKDEELLEETGGIVQGMSGSPIIQNGKLIGVLTHVLVDDVKTGYAIFAETMYNKMITCK